MELSPTGQGIQDLARPIQTISHWGGTCKPVGGRQELLPLPGVLQAEPTREIGFASQTPQNVATNCSTCLSGSGTKASLGDMV